MSVVVWTWVLFKFALTNPSPFLTDFLRLAGPGSMFSFSFLQVDWCRMGIGLCIEGGMMMMVGGKRLRRRGLPLKLQLFSARKKLILFFKNTSNRSRRNWTDRFVACYLSFHRTFFCSSRSHNYILVEHNSSSAMMFRNSAKQQNLRLCEVSDPESPDHRQSHGISDQCILSVPQYKMFELAWSVFWSQIALFWVNEKSGPREPHQMKPTAILT
jgi:hypothetical protein